MDKERRRNASLHIRWWRLGLGIEIEKNGMIGLGKVDLVSEVFEIVPQLLLVALEVVDGWKIGLQDDVLSWHNSVTLQHVTVL